MNKPAYTKIITLLDAARDVLVANAGDLNPADLRIRCLVNITGKEAQRALLEIAAASAGIPAPPTNSGSSKRAASASAGR